MKIGDKERVRVKGSIQGGLGLGLVLRHGRRLKTEPNPTCMCKSSAEVRVRGGTRVRVSFNISAEHCGIVDAAVLDEG